MIITDIQCIPVFTGVRNILHVLVKTDEGIWGIGESGLSGRELAVQGVVEHFKPLLIGQDPFRTEYLWQALSRGAFFPAQRVQSSALSAIDIALWDIKGKALGVPVYQLLGGLAREKVLCYCHLGDPRELAPVLDNARRKIEAGWKMLRFGLPIDGPLVDPRKSVRRSIEAFAKLRELVGDDIDIIIDIHTRLDLPDAIWLCRELEPMRPYFVEDPLRSENFAQYRALRPHVHVPLAAGEQCASKWEFRELIEEQLIDFCRIDPCLGGGLTEAKKIAGWCEVYHIQLAVHNPLGPVSTAACVHLNLACPNVGVMEQPDVPGMCPEVFPRQMEWKDGYLLPPTAPGLGVDFDVDEALKRPFRPWEPPQTRRLDGSVTNW